MHVINYILRFSFGLDSTLQIAHFMEVSMVRSLVVFSFVLFGMSACAQTPDGTTISKACKTVVKFDNSNATQLNPSFTVAAGTCVGLVHGVMDMMQLWEGADLRKSDGNLHGCIPTEVTTIQAIRVVVKFLDDNPQKLHGRDSFLIQEALAQAFPCRT